MRITLTIPTAATSPSPPTTSGPLVKLGGTGELVLIELQGELGYEGDPRGRVVGLLGFERMDKPTLYLGKHHLLHGKIVTLPRPLAVIRRVAVVQDLDEEDVDPDSEEDQEAGASDQELTDSKRPKLSSNLDNPPTTPSRSKSAIPPYLQTPTRKPHLTAAAREEPQTSSPPGYQQRDYSSDLSSPFPISKTNSKIADTVETADCGGGRKRKSSTTTGGQTGKHGTGKQRTREYETVAVVWKKIVFGLR